MSGFNNNSITLKGAVAIAALVAGGTLEFTRIAVGDGKLPADKTPLTMTDLAHRLFDVQISEVRSDSEAQATVLGTFSNADNETEYYYRELGLFAKDPATGAEILYCYANAGDDAEVIPPGGGTSLLEKEVRIVTLIGNATNVTAHINSGLYPTFAQMNAKLALKADLDATAEEGGRVVPEQMRFDASQTLYVDAAAAAAGADGSEAKPFKTIQAAVDAAYRGADLIKVEIKPGTYAENVRTPVGTGSSWVFEKYGSGTVSAKSFTIDIAPYVRIEGTSLTPDAGGRAIRMVNVASAAIESNIVNGNSSGFGISVFRGSVRLNGNTINNCGTAVYAAEGAVVTSIGTAGTGNVVGLHAEGAIILQHPDSTISATTPYKQSNGGAVNIEGGASSFPSSFGQRSSLGEFSSAATLRSRLIAELQKLNAGEFKSFSFRQSISGGFGSLAANQTSHVLIQKTANDGGGYGILIFYSHASAPVSTMKINNGAFVETGPVVLIDETRLATTTQYGLARLASEADVLNEAQGAAVDTQLVYEINDFRRMNTAYSVGDKVNCAFRFEYFLECTKAGTTNGISLDTRSVTFGQVITDGSAQWTVRAHAKSVNSKVADANGNISINDISGNAGSATKLQTAREISLTGGATASLTFDGSKDASAEIKLTAMKGATSSAAGALGAVPAPAAGENDEFLRGDGTWQTPIDNKVSQTSSTANGKYPILLKASTSTSNATAGALFDADVAVNPSTGALCSKTFAGRTKSTKWVQGAQVGGSLLESEDNDNGGEFIPIFRYKSTNGTFVLNGHRDGFLISYLTQENVDNGTNTVSESLEFTEDGLLVSTGGFKGGLSGNASTATKLQTKRTIDGMQFDGSANIHHYATCSTAAATAAKTVTLSGFTLATGARITVRFTVTNTASSPTLNVNGTGAKNIRYRNANISAGYLAANRTYEFVYDGTYYQLVGDLDTNTTYSVASQAEAEEGTNNSHVMTPLRVKQAINYVKPLVNTDANTIKTTGLYDCYTTGSTLLSNLNFPINEWGKLNVTETKNYIIQEYVPDITIQNYISLSYKRSFNKLNADDETTSVGNWSEWMTSGIDTIVGIYSYNTDNAYAVCRLLESGIMYIGGTGMFPKGSNSVTINLPYPCAKNQEPIIVVTPTWDVPTDIPKLSRGGLSAGTNTSQFVVNQEGTTTNTWFTWFGFANWK